MKFCTNCGNQLADNAMFCPKCGCATGSTAEAQPPVQPQQPVNQGYGGQGYQQGYNQGYNQGYQQQNTQANQWGPAPYAPPAESSKAKNSKIFGILSFFIFPVIFSIVAIALAGSSKKETGGVLCSDAKVGMVCGIITLVLGLLGTLVSIILMATVGLGALASL